MAYGIKSAQSAATNGSAVVWKANTVGKLISVSTAGNSGVVYIGEAGVGSTTGMAIPKDVVIDWGETEDMDFSRMYVYGTGSDKISFTYINRKAS